MVSQSVSQTQSELPDVVELIMAASAASLDPLEAM